MNLNLKGSKEILRQININVKNKNDTEIINNIADKFYEMDKEVRDTLKKNVKKGLEKSSKNYIVKMQICQRLVGLDKENELFDLISEKAAKMFYGNRKRVIKFNRRG